VPTDSIQWVESMAPAVSPQLGATLHNNYASKWKILFLPSKTAGRVRFIKKTILKLVWPWALGCRCLAVVPLKTLLDLPQFGNFAVYTLKVEGLPWTRGQTRSMDDPLDVLLLQ
jgi:hypothetical protein